MNAMTAFTLRSLAKNRVRTLVTVLGIALAAALLTAVLTSVASANHYLQRVEEETDGTWIAAIVSDDPTMIERAEAEPNIPDFTIAQTDLASLSERPLTRDTEGVPSTDDAGASTASDASTSNAPASALADDINQVTGIIPLMRFTGDYPTICGIFASEGRLPENDGEVLLPSQYSSKIADSSHNTGLSGNSYSFHSSSENYEAITTPAYKVGDMATFRLEDGSEETLTVVGFYDNFNNAVLTKNGAAAISVMDAPTEQNSFVIWAVVDHLTTRDELTGQLEATFPGATIDLHSTLLNYLGLAGQSYIWRTFGGIAIILAIVIAVACVSLIYNAFGISVADRTRQFGLLASVGASKRQLRRSVFFEAFLVALVGIPLGLVVGIGGCAVVLGLLGSQLASLLNGEVSTNFGVWVEGWVLALTAAITLLTVIVSAWIPARRAGKVSAIEAISRRLDIRDTRTSVTKKRDAKVENLWKARPLAFLSHAFGVPGQIARLNRKRGRLKSATASVSLGLAIVLLMTSGFFSSNLSLITSSFASTSFDLEVYGTLDPFNQSLEGTSVSMPADVASLPDDSLSARPPAEDPATTEPTGTAHENTMAFLTDFYDEMCSTAGLIPQGWVVYQSGYTLVPDAMAGNAIAPNVNASLPNLESWGMYAHICALPKKQFEEFAASQGISPEDYVGTNRAIAINQLSEYEDNHYVLTEVLSQTGEISYIAGAHQGAIEAMSIVENVHDLDGNTTISLVGTYPAEDDRTPVFPLVDAELSLIPIEVSALVTERPEILGNSSNDDALWLIVPESSALSAMFFPYPTDEQTFSQTSKPYRFMSGFNVENIGDIMTTELALANRGGDYLSDTWPAYFDFSVEDVRSLVGAIQVLNSVVTIFSLLFTLILALIALANVFNTLTNGIILRQREFAVMKSIGMGGRAFNSMIACECVTYSLKGLVIGVIVALLVGFGLYQMMSISYYGLSFKVPWDYLGISLAMIVVVMVASVAYGLRRTRSDSIVDALRADSI